MPTLGPGTPSPANGLQYQHPNSGGFASNELRKPSDAVMNSDALKALRSSLSGGYAVGNPILGTPSPMTRPNLHYSTESSDRILSKHNLQELVRRVYPEERLDPYVESLLLEIADEFVESIVNFASKLTRHLRSETLEMKDAQLH
jgi:transcription initiation factor TFIID subunit TAF12